jgi:hypothetical protein
MEDGMKEHGRSRPALVAASGDGARRAETSAAGWFNAEMAVAVPVIGEGVAPRTIAIFADGLSASTRFHLSAGAAAELMFQIGHALEQAASLDKGRVPLPRIGRILPTR